MNTVQQSLFISLPGGELELTWVPLLGVKNCTFSAGAQ